MTTNFICDIGSGHNQDYDRCVKLITTAKTIGANSVKLQIFKAEELYAPQYKEKIKILKDREFPLEWLPDITKLCNTLDIGLGASVFHLSDVEYVAEYVDYLKVASYELNWHRLISEYRQTGLPIVISTGLATSNEIINALQHTDKDQCPVLLHCNSTYPAKPEECNLAYIKELQRYANIVGWSDHTGETGVIIAAIYYGADVIEFHLDLDDMKGAESSAGHCWAALDALQMIQDVKNFEVGLLSQDLENKDELRLKRTDPSDGLRPNKEIR